MKQQYLKIVIITGIIIAMLIFGLIRVNAQENLEQLKILTEMRVDIKYIKSNINEIKNDNKTAGEQVNTLKNRVTKVEERQTNIKNDLYEIAGRNNWVTGFIGSILLLMLGLQLKRSYSHRKNNDGKTTH